MLLCGTLTSKYVLRCYMLLLQANMATLVYGILSQAIMFAQLCVPTVGVIYVTCEIWVYEICFYFCLSCVWRNQIGVAALSVKIEALEKQVSADSVDRALVCVRQLAGQPGSTTDMLDN